MSVKKMEFRNILNGIENPHQYFNAGFHTDNKKNQNHFIKLKNSI